MKKNEIGGYKMNFNKKITGFQNEIEIAKSLNNKLVGELNLLYRNFLEDLFGELCNEDLVKCVVDYTMKKYDIIISINNEKKYVSLKKGIKNSIHVESISSFIHFLIENKIDKRNITQYLKYHYADGTTNGTGKRTLTFPDYKLKLKRKIRKVNKYFMKHEDLLIKLINRFVIGSTDILIHGTVDNFTYITKDEIIKLLLSLKKEPSSTIHFSRLIFASKGRNNDIDKFIVQIKWYNLADDIEIIRKNLPV